MIFQKYGACWYRMNIFDHSGKIQEFINSGIDCYAPKETYTYRGISSHRAKQIKDKHTFNIGGFKIMSFSLFHDTTCFGYLIFHKEIGLTLFATDTYKIPYNFGKINNFIIEANYSFNILDENILNGKLNEFVRNRVLKSHLSLEYLEDFFKRSDLSETRNIVLIHLSGGNSSPVGFKNRIEVLTGKKVFIASKGLKIDISEKLF